MNKIEGMKEKGWARETAGSYINTVDVPGVGVFAMVVVYDRDLDAYLYRGMCNGTLFALGEEISVEHAQDQLSRIFSKAIQIRTRGLPPVAVGTGA